MITVLLFAHLQEQFGVDKLTIDEPTITVSALKERLEREYNWNGAGSTMIAVNEEYAAEDEVIKAGDTVALIPPVSGG